MDKSTARKPRKPQLNLEVVERKELSPGMVRVVCSILNHEDYQDITPPEKYVKLVFFSDATLAETPAGEFPDYWSVRESAAPEDLPVTRHMTLRRYDAAAGTLWIDVALHGIEGHAGPWAATAKPGDRLVAVGPGGNGNPIRTLPGHCWPATRPPFPPSWRTSKLFLRPPGGWQSSRCRAPHTSMTSMTWPFRRMSRFAGSTARVSNQVNEPSLWRSPRPSGPRT